MEWRDVPGYPGYQVNARGVLRKSSGYVLGKQGKRYCLSRGGGKARLTPEELIALAWPPKGEEAPQVQPAPAPVPVIPTPVEKPRKAVPEGFVPVPGLPGYYINREGVCLGRSGRPLTVHRSEYPSGGGYTLGHTYASIGRLLNMTFGPGAAVAAGYPEPKPVDAERQTRAASRRNSMEAGRRCHDCGRPTNNYRCPDCWARLRGTTAEAEESEWNAL